MTPGWPLAVTGGSKARANAPGWINGAPAGVESELPVIGISPELGRVEYTIKGLSKV